ncbi:MAG: hypothetical protein RIS17_1086 [Pseudomonadota bacterium]|jgi:hypothetical protein
MKTVPEGTRSATEAMTPDPRTAPRNHHAFHVELTPVAVDARPFHAVHGIPGAAVPAALPSHWDAEPADPGMGGETES